MVLMFLGMTPPWWEWGCSWLEDVMAISNPWGHEGLETHPGMS